MECLNCQTPVPQTLGKRPKLYCSETCRVAFFRQKKAGDGVKKGKGRPRKHIAVSPQKVYDAKKLPDTTLDEAGKYATGIDPHSKGPSKGKTVVYKTGSKKDPNSSELEPLVKEMVVFATAKKKVAKIIDGIKKERTPQPEPNFAELLANPEVHNAIMDEAKRKNVKIASEPHKQEMKPEVPYPKDWDKMGRLDKMKWLTANR